LAGSENEHGIGKALGDLLDGGTDVCWVRGFASAETCKSISKSFYCRDGAKPRVDNVPGVMVGESHYFKAPADYYRMCQEQKASVEELFSNAEDPVRRIYSIIENHRGVDVRPALWDGQEALHTRAIAWKEIVGSPHLLRPHDDVSQVFCDRNDGWEIQQVNTLIALNFYAQCQAGHGMLRVYDLKCTPDLAKRFDLEGIGYPYPQDFLNGFDYIDIPVQTGDVVMLDGSFIHGVTKSSADRLVLNSFVGEVSEREAVYWT